MADSVSALFAEAIDQGVWFLFWPGAFCLVGAAVGGGAASLRSWLVGWLQLALRERLTTAVLAVAKGFRLPACFVCLLFAMDRSIQSLLRSGLRTKDLIRIYLVTKPKSISLQFRMVCSSAILKCKQILKSHLITSDLTLERLQGEVAGLIKAKDEHMV